MYNEDEQVIRSPLTSRAGSYNEGLTSRTNGRPYQARSSITEETGREDNEYEGAPNESDVPPVNVGPPPRSEDQYISALRYRFPNRPKSDYAYSKPAGPAGKYFQIFIFVLKKSTFSSNWTTPSSYYTNVDNNSSSNNNNNTDRNNISTKKWSISIDGKTKHRWH